MQAEQQSEREALREMIASYGFAFHTAVSIPSMHDKMRAKADGILEAILDRAALSRPSTPQGWKLVPVEPTNEMVFDGAQLDGVLSYDLALAVYREMLNAAPPPPEQGSKG